MQAAEVRDAGTLVGTTLEELTVAVRDVHRAVSGRVFDALGGPARPVRVCHDALAGASFASVRAGARWLPALAGLALAPRADGRSVHSTRGGRVATSKINGAIGSRVVEQAGSLSTPMSLRSQQGRPTTDISLLVDGLDAPGERLVIFIHGLCESDACWELGAEQAWGDPRVSYGTKLAQDAGWTPLYVNYNSGLRISANGVELDALLDRVVDEWPLPVRDLAIVGHSMGGLIARSAAHHGGRWTSALRTIVLLGAPNHGAPLERVVNRGTHTLGRWPETRPLARFLNERSVGIKDLRHGSLLEADWLGRDLDDPTDHCGVVPLRPGVDHYVVAATLTRRFDSPFAPYVGDLLVQWTSATGQHAARAIPFDPDGWLHVGRASHFGLFNRPEVYERLRVWLA